MPEHSKQNLPQKREDTPTNYAGTRFGSSEDLGIGRYRTNRVCYGEAPANLEQFMWDANRNAPTDEFPHLKIDIGAMLIVTLGNPFHVGFEIRGNQEHTQFNILCKNEPVSFAFLYRDPHRNACFFSPEVADDYRDLGLEMINYILGARISYLLWNQPLHTNPLQLSHSAENTWKVFVEHGLARKLAPKEYAMLEGVAKSNGASSVLRSLLKQSRWHDLITEAVGYDDPIVNPKDLRREYKNGIQVHDLWMETLPAVK